MPTAREVIGIVGVGTMGSGIGQRFAQEGYHVVLVDQDESKVQAGFEKIERSLTEAVTKEVITEKQKVDTLSRITASTQYQSLKDATLVIEAVFENLGVKKDVFKKLSQVTSPKTILATNTSSFRVEDLVKVTSNPERLMGLHYFFHPAKNKLVEIVAHSKTSRTAIRKAWALNQAIGKFPISCADAYGFVVNRFLIPLMNEATRLLEQRKATMEEIDFVVQELLGIKMGPFQLINATGPAVCFHACTTLGQAFGSFYKTTAFMKAQFDKKQNWPVGQLPTTVDSSKAEIIRNQILGAVFIVVGQILDEKIASKEDCDLGARTGLLWKLGPFALMNSIGKEKTSKICHDFCRSMGVAMPKSLQDHFSNPSDWQFLHLWSQVEGAMGRIVFARPDRMNSLNLEVLEQLETAFDGLEKNPAVDTIIIETIGKTFIAGADLKFFSRHIADKNFEAIDRMIRYGQKIFARIDNSSKLVIAKVSGPAFGGGTELALCADVLILSDRATISLPETSLGIIPGWGGTQRTGWFASKAVAKYIVYTGLPIGGKEAIDLSLAEYISPLADMEQVALAVSENANRLSKHHRDAVSIPHHLETLFQLLEHHTVSELMAPQFQIPNDAAAQKALGAMKKKPLSALLAAERAIERGAKLRNLADGLPIEVEEFNAIIHSENAREGIQAFIDRRPPRFK